MLLMVLAITAKAQLPELTDHAEFYLLTCEPGQESYTRFGHSGIRVTDDDLDISFNWGVFSFEDPNFIGRFVLGHTDYRLAVFFSEIFLMDYEERGSAVYQHHLELTQEEKAKLWAMLDENFKPENREYRYNFIYDNCATRVYDMIMGSFEEAKSDFCRRKYDKTYRQIVNSYSTPDTWLSLGINLLFGAEADEKITYRESTAFPIESLELLKTVKKIETDSTDTVEMPIIGSEEILFNSDKLYKDKKYNKLAATGMFMIPIVILIFLVIYFFRHHLHYCKPVTEVLLWLTFTLSLLIAFLSLFSTHPLVDKNYNLLWCNPLNGVLAILLLMHGRRRLKAVLSLITMLMAIVWFPLYFVNVQGATIPLVGYYILMLGTQVLIFATYAEMLKTLFVGGNKKHHHHHHHHSGQEHHHHHHQENA